MMVAEIEGIPKAREQVCEDNSVGSIFKEARPDDCPCTLCNARLSGPCLPVEISLLNARRIASGSLGGPSSSLDEAPCVGSSQASVISSRVYSKYFPSRSEDTIVSMRDPKPRHLG